MGKLKTVKSVAKRVRVTGGGKIIKKKAGQDHFNSRESGKVTRHKRKFQGIHQADLHKVKTFIPYK